MDPFLQNPLALLEPSMEDVPTDAPMNVDAGMFPMTQKVVENTPNEDEILKRKRKLERNREVARQSRYRKRERTTTLEQENARLREINRQLELKLKLHLSQLGKPTAGRSGRGEDEEKKRAADVKDIEKLISLKAGEKELLHRLNYYKDTYSDFGLERRSLVETHIAQLKALMLPNQVSKVLMWLFQQDESFYTDKSNSSMWNLLCKELKLDETQIEKVMEMRKLFKARKSVLPRSLEMIKSLDSQLKADFDSRSGQMVEFDKVLSTTQEAKFLVWVENNKACVHLLNTMWMNIEGTKPNGSPIKVKDEEEEALTGSSSPVENSLSPRS